MNIVEFSNYDYYTTITNTSIIDSTVTNTNANITTATALTIAVIDFPN